MIKYIVSLSISLLVLTTGVFAFTLDKKVTLDDDGFWGAHYDIPKYAFVGIVASALYEGTESRFGSTAWKSLDAGFMSQVFSESSKLLTGRVRPRHTDNPSEWFKGGKSFFSGHVSGMTALVTPFVLEYQSDYPLVHLLWALPLHQMGGRVKAQAHWQSDVIVGAMVGFLSGYLAHERDSPLILYFDGDKVVTGFKYKF
jgi:undecaprenyl-diphosphatase